MLISLSTPVRDRGVWAIGDVHGCAETLKRLYTKIAPRRCYLLGDLIDRGPDSKGVLDFAMAHPSTVIALMGNHEDMMLSAWANPNAGVLLRHWFYNSGGEETLASFGTDGIKKVPRKYINWMRAMPIVRRFGTTVLSHAGADLSKPRPYSTTGENREFLMWNRKVKPPPDPAFSIIVGHTPVSLATSRASVAKRKVMIDGGCVRGGRLIAYNLDTKQIVSVKNID